MLTCSYFAAGQGWPTVVYEVVVDRSRRIMSATDGHPGARNDKTIVRYDDLVQGMHKGGM